jgi:hypothetical protein
MTTETTTRPIYIIADDIIRNWKKPYFGAVPYLAAMRFLHTTNDTYGYDDGRSIVMYFLANSSTWRGETARRLKEELKELLKASARK